ncbi:MAG: alpha/beta hydrolase [Candidatus Nanopelagicales bacterium]
MNHHDIPRGPLAPGSETTGAQALVDVPVRPPDQSTAEPAKPAFRWLTAAAPAVVAGLVAGWLIPRGPVTTPEAVSALIAAVLVGAMTGWWLRSRWALILAPATFMVIFELARVRVDGPTVDGVRLDGIYGVMALVAGRGVDAVLVLLPMMVGASYGAALARRRLLDGAKPDRQRGRRTVLGLATLAVMALFLGLVRPASTAPIVGTDAEPIAGSIAELVEVPIGGHDQAIMLRGVSREAPVLLYLEGGPGGTGIGRIRNSGTDLEQSFVVATWDQRGTGKSFDALDPVSTLTVDQMVADTLAVTNYLRERFSEEKIYLVGSSWGTTPGTLAVQRSPELFHAYVGTGQMVDQFETDTLMYAESLADAEARGDAGSADALRALGPPPYDNTLDYPIAISSNPKWMNFEHGADYRATSEYPASLFVAEYALIEGLRGMAAIAETFDVLYPQLADTDFRIDVPRLDVPVYIVEGSHEAAGRETLAAQWFQALSAPSKAYVSFERSGHTPPYDEPGRFADFMADVLRATGGAGS